MMRRVALNWLKKFIDITGKIGKEVSEKKPLRGPFKGNFDN